MINYSIAILGTTPGTKKVDIVETKVYGVSQVHDVLDLNKFAEHIADHNSPFSKGMVKGILTDAVACLREQMLAGNKVNLGELGSFYPELQTEGAVTTEDFSVENIKAVNVCWLPGKDFKNLRQEAEFRLVPSRAAQADDIKIVRHLSDVQRIVVLQT